MIRIINGNCKDVLKEIESNSIDSCVTDPPYGLVDNRKNGESSGGFMGYAWDGSGIEYDASMWAEVLRVLKPGSHLLAFGGTRTYHRMTMAIEMAGFHIRDMVTWIHSQGFPKSFNLGGDFDGWGTSLKPACEPICLARKPFEGTVLANMKEYGTGALNIDKSRIKGEPIPVNILEKWSGFGQEKNPEYSQEINTSGRWPANLVFDEESIKELDNQVEGASRFFYCAKPSKAERNEGLAGIPTKTVHRYGAGMSGGKFGDEPSYEKNIHPTVKPIELMRYLCNMVTPKNGIILDPFAGSGSTGCAAVIDDFNFIGIELGSEYCDIARRRIFHYEEMKKIQPKLFDMA